MLIGATHHFEFSYEKVCGMNWGLVSEHSWAFFVRGKQDTEKSKNTKRRN